MIQTGETSSETFEKIIQQKKGFCEMKKHVCNNGKIFAFAVIIFLLGDILT